MKITSMNIHFQDHKSTDGGEREREMERIASSFPRLARLQAADENLRDEKIVF
jgi:hypothetical protein